MHNRFGSALIFLATMVVGGSLLLSEAMQARPLLSLSIVITDLSEDFLQLLGFTVDRTSRVLGSRATGFAMRVDNECNGAWAHLIFLASVLAYPATWKEKSLGVLVGETLIFFLNIFRVASLFVIGVYAPTIFRATHVYVWQFLIIGLALLLFFVWVDRFVRPQA